MKIQKQWFTNLLRHKSSEKFHKFHWKTIALESLLNKVAGPDEHNFIKKRLQHRCFPLKFAKFLRTSFSTVHLRYTLAFKNNQEWQFVQRFFNDISHAQQVSDHLQLSQWQTNLKMHSFTKKFVPIERFSNRFRANSFLPEIWYKH